MKKRVRRKWLLCTSVDQFRQWLSRREIAVIVGSVIAIIILPIGFTIWKQMRQVVLQPPVIADMLVIEPASTLIASRLAQPVGHGPVRIQWSRRGVLCDTILPKCDEESVAHILVDADTMNHSYVQEGLRTIIRRGDGIAADTTLQRWSLIIIGRLPEEKKPLIGPEETNALRRNSKLKALFFLPPVPDNSMRVTGVFIQLLRNEGVEVRKEVL